MAEEKLDTRAVNWRQLLPWTEIFRGFGIALDLNKLLLAAAGILVMSFGWWLLAIIFGAGYPSQPPQWPGSYQTVKAASGEDPWLAFKSDRDRWNLMHEAAGLGKSDKIELIEVADLAESSEEYNAVSKAVGDVPDHYDLAALDKLQMRPDAKSPSEEHPLDPAKVRLYKARLGKPKLDGTLARMPWSEDRGPNPYLLVTGQAGIPWETNRALEWFAREQFPVLIEPLVKLMRPIVYFLSPRADSFGTKLYFLLVFVWTVLTWSLFGGAITRIAVVQVARPGEPIGMTEAFRFTLKRLLSYVAAPLFPLALVFVLLIFGSIFSLFYMIPIFGDIFVGGLLWGVMLLLGLVMALALVGLAVGWPLMAPTISAEGTDSWEALSRSFSYVFQRPWHYLWYAAVMLAYGAVVVFFVGFMGSLTVYLSKWSVAQMPRLVLTSREPSFLFVYAPQSFGWRTLLLQGAKDDFGENPTKESLVQGGQINRRAYDHYIVSLNSWNKIGAILVWFWLILVFLLILGFGYSFFFSTTTIIYLLMRRNLDAAEIDEVYLEEEDQDGFGAPPVPASMPEPEKATRPLQMVEPPSLRPVTPPSPTITPPPAVPSHHTPPASVETPAVPPKDGADSANN